MARRSGVSRDVAFEDWLLAMVCSLSNGQMEDQYMAMIQRHSDGKPGKRGCDLMAQMFGKLVQAMNETRRDILGDLYTAAITRGQDGQYFTPDPVVQVMVDLVLSEVEDDSERKTVGDPCCGSGRMLMAVAEKHPNWEFVGTDIDLRCVRIASLNMALWNRYAWIIWGNSLTLETKLAYRTGFNMNGGVIREVPPEQSSLTLPVIQ
jgi:type I restriction-modification system DNA methylase subunit